MTNPLSIALSGMQAATKRVDAAASNIANAGTTGSVDKNATPQPYTPVDIVQTSQENGGTRADTVARDPASTLLYQPDAPFASADGYIAAPAVDLAGEVISAKQAALSYKANAAVVKTVDDMEKEMLDRFDQRV